MNSPLDLPPLQAQTGARTLHTLDWAPRFGRLPGKFYTRLQPTALPEPYLIAYNPDALGLISLRTDAPADPHFAEILSGSRVPPGADPLEIGRAHV